MTLCSKDEQRDFEWYWVWNEWESKNSSTLREIETVKRILCDSADLIKNKSVEIKSDNKNVPHILKVGSRKKKVFTCHCYVGA